MCSKFHILHTEYPKQLRSKIITITKMHHRRLHSNLQTKCNSIAYPWKKVQISYNMHLKQIPFPNYHFLTNNPPKHTLRYIPDWECYLKNLELLGWNMDLGHPGPIRPPRRSTRPKLKGQDPSWAWGNLRTALMATRCDHWISQVLILWPNAKT